ncbi:MAG: FAD binding domain-containing protein, partial [Pseudomonadota bacterium]
MKRFEHHSAYSIEEAAALLHDYQGKAKVNAGGTDLLGALKDEAVPEYPAAVINIKTIAGLDYIRSDGNGLTIGALARLADIVKSPIVNEGYGLLVQAAHSVGTPHIRNMATIGGNLAQDVRCWFYRYPRHIGGPMVCLRKGGKFCSALAGDNRYHSIFGAASLTDSLPYSHKIRKGCFAVGPSDIAVALVALDADILTTKRTVPAQSFFRITATSTTVMEADELIKEIRIPQPQAGARRRYDKFTLRKPVDFAVVSVASILTMDDGVCRDARIVLGAVAPEPVRCANAEEVLKGRIINGDIAAE